MSLLGFMVRHTGGSRYPGFFIFSIGLGFLLEFTPYSIRGRNDTRKAMDLRVDFKSPHDFKFSVLFGDGGNPSPLGEVQ